MPSSWLLSVGTLIASSIIAPAGADSRPAGSYHLSEKWHADTFTEHIDFFTAKDPTNGFVNYVDQKTAEKNGLFKIKSDGSLYMGVDHSSTIDPNGAGRDSVRIESKGFYDYGLYVVDVAHMPGSICGTWPAFWSVGPSWPENGEIDIIEGVNKNPGNEVVLHTSGSCAVSEQDMTGDLTSHECGEASGTIGCVVKGANGTTGTPFNEKGGGVYAMERSPEFIKIWYFPRGSTPESLTNGEPDTASFGRPMAHLQGDCDFGKRFTEQKLVFNTDFCGDWAGGIFGKDGECPMSDPSDTFKSCKTFVAQNPEKFKEAYWEINSVQVFSPGAGGSGSHSGGPPSGGPPSGPPHSHPEPPATTQFPVSSPIVHPSATGTESSVPSAETTSATETTQVPETTAAPDTTSIPPSTDLPVPAEATTPSATQTPASTDAPATQAQTQPPESVSRRRSTVYHTSTTTICSQQSTSSRAAAIGVQQSTTTSAIEETTQPSESTASTPTSTPTPDNDHIGISGESTSASGDVAAATTSAAPVHDVLVTDYSTVSVETTICPGSCSKSTSAPAGADAVAASPTSSVAHVAHIAASSPETSSVAAPSIPASTNDAKPFTPLTTKAAPATSVSISSPPTSSTHASASHAVADMVLTSTVSPMPATKSSHKESSTPIIASSSPSSSMSRVHGASQSPSRSSPSGSLFTGAAGRVSVGASTGFIGVVAAAVFLV